VNTKPPEEELGSGGADDRRVLRAYRAASTALDEAPVERTRAAILAAAARASGARPRPVVWTPRWRLPLAAAAGVLVGALALLLATQVEREPPAETAATVAVAPWAPPSAPVAAGASPGAPPASSVDRPAAAVQRGAGLSPAPSRDRAAIPAAAADAPVQGAPATATATAADARTEPARAPAEASEPPSLAPPQPPAAVASPGSTAQRRQAESPASVDAGLADRAAGESRSQLAAAPATPWRATPEAWIERIVKLRAEGRHGDADVELAALRARHPVLRLPPAALPVSER
jgi:hypothetical protein